MGGGTQPGCSLGTGRSTSGMRVSTRAWYRMWSQLRIHLRMGSHLHRETSLSFGRTASSGSSSLREPGDRVSHCTRAFPTPVARVTSGDRVVLSKHPPLPTAGSKRAVGTTSQQSDVQT